MLSLGLSSEASQGVPVRNDLGDSRPTQLPRTKHAVRALRYFLLPRDGEKPGNDGQLDEEPDRAVPSGHDQVRSARVERHGDWLLPVGADRDGPLNVV